MGVLDSPLVSAPAVRDDPPAPDDWGMVVRPLPSAGLQSWRTEQVAVGLVAVQVAAAALADRRGVSLRARCTPGAEIFVGNSNLVTILTGTGLMDRETISIDLEATSQIWAIATADGQILYVTEVAAT